MATERDFVGYGRNVPRIQWPGGARIAVSLVVNYEEGSEYSLLDGDDHHESNNEVPSPIPPGQRDLYNESFFEYGSRVGVWRLLDMFDRHQVKSTFYCCAQALERNPDLAREITAQGPRTLWPRLPLGRDAPDDTGRGEGGHAQDGGCH